METITLDSGQRAKVSYDPYWITYECARCRRYDEDTQRHSHFDGERWVQRRYCGDCIEAVV